MEGKAAFRRRVLSLPPFAESTKRHMDESIFRALMSLSELNMSKSVFSYVNMASEPDTRSVIAELIRRGSALSVPRCRAGGRMDAVLISSLSELSASPPYGILEPPPGFPEADPSAIDAIIVPGVAFTEDGRRLGHGAGYYDRFFCGCRAIRIALSYERAVVPYIPTEKHDCPVDIIVTEMRIIRAG